MLFGSFRGFISTVEGWPGAAAGAEGVAAAGAGAPCPAGLVSCAGWLAHPHSNVNAKLAIRPLFMAFSPLWIAAIQLLGKGPQDGSRTSAAWMVRRCLTRPSLETAASTPRPSR